MSESPGRAEQPLNDLPADANEQVRVIALEPGVEHPDQVVRDGSRA
jgi:hypothetical protein